MESGGVAEPGWGGDQTQGGPEALLYPRVS